ncbi:MAG: glycosyl transferase [Bacteroidaceae bacterium]|nr:glycosyl transferase [Bacteroidaceae bacterium]
MIPKIIHYCWFGRGEMPELARMCIESWHHFLPDYEYRLWNEDNFDVNANSYTKEAYEARKFAFVTDYVRLWALERFGGIYMDTDVEILKPLDDLLELTAFTGYEGSKHIPPVTGLMASQKGGEWVREQLAYYDNRHFRLEDGTLDMTTNTQIISSIMKVNGFVSDGKYQVYKDMHVFPVEYFCPRQTTGEILLTSDTYCDHHFMGTWGDKPSKSRLVRLVGQKNMTRLIKLKRKLFG